MNNELSDHNKAIDILELLAAEPDGDTMARLDADELDAVLYAIRVLRANPPAPKYTIKADNRGKVGKWRITGRGIWTHNYKCSLCGEGLLSCKLDTPAFCDNCGAQMETEI